MTTKYFDNTVSQLLQDQTAVEYVDPKENPIATIPNDGKTDTNPLFNFHAEHNGEACIESFDPKDRGTERQFRFTRALLCTLLGVKSEDTIASHVDKLLKRGVVTETRNLVSVMLPDSLGRECIKTTLYDLKVFNYLVMRLDTDQAWEKKAKFNDVLVKHETGVAQPELTDAEIMSRALEIAHRTLALREERIKALEAERDEAIRTKTHFVAGRDAKVCGELGGLRAQNEALRKQIGDAKKYKAVTAISWLPDYFDISNRGLYVSIAAKLKKLEAEMPPAFAHTDIQDSRWGSVKAYHVAVIERLHEMVQADENLMKKYRKIASV